MERTPVPSLEPGYRLRLSASAVSLIPSRREGSSALPIGIRVFLSMSRNLPYSIGVTRVMATPDFPALPVLPIRWMYPSGSRGML